ncbi:MAG: trypsin-like peptidase domain-containing protein [Burkholderiaceae bacterium]|nr:trypsin-like peptidase domain-containing protein [Burkholderiaceae bacterium]
MSTQIKDMRTPPFQWICSIQTSYDRKVRLSPDKPLDSEGYTHFGTGVLITERHVLTCAHNVSAVYQYKGKWLSKKPVEIRVKVGRNDEGYSVKPFWYRAKLPAAVSGLFGNYRTNKDQDALRELAVIELKSPIGEKKFVKSGKRLKVGWWSSAYMSYIRPVEGSFKTALRKKKINVCGYPGDADPGGQNDTTAGIPVSEFVSVAGVGTDTRPLLTFYATMGNGQSGGPVWVVDRNTKKRYLVAVYFGRDNNTGAQLGRLITPDVINQLENWGIQRHKLSLSQTPSVA